MTCDKLAGEGEVVREEIVRKMKIRVEFSEERAGLTMSLQP